MDCDVLTCTVIIRIIIITKCGVRSTEITFVLVIYLILINSILILTKQQILYVHLK